MQSTQQFPSIDLLRNNSKLFSPFELNENINLPLFDIDPDVQFYNDQCTNVLQCCDYYVEDTFNEKISQLKLNNGCLSMFHCNIRSAHKNLNKLDNFFSNLNLDFQILGISESWLNESNKDLYNLDGYVAEHNCRSGRTGGGVSLYIKQNVHYFLRNDLSFQNKNIESLFIEIEMDQFGKKIKYGCWSYL